MGLEMVGLYWHFVDVVWVVIFTLIYLLPSGSGGLEEGIIHGGPPL